MNYLLYLLVYFAGVQSHICDAINKIIFIICIFRGAVWCNGYWNEKREKRVRIPIELVTFTYAHEFISSFSSNGLNGRKNSILNQPVYCRKQWQYNMD